MALIVPYLNDIEWSVAFKILTCCYHDSQECGARLMYNLIRASFRKNTGFDKDLVAHAL